MKNLLYNGTTNTGLYYQYRVWRTAVEISSCPNNAADMHMMALAPTVSAGSFASLSNLAQAPFSVSAHCFFAMNRGTVMRKTFDWPQIFGITKTEFAQLSGGTSGSSLLPPTSIAFLQFRYQTDINSATVGSIGHRILVKFLCEFFNPTDTALIDT